MNTMRWSFLSNHGKALLGIARDPGARLREIADAVPITQRRAHDIVTDLAVAGYVVKTKQGRPNRHTIQSHLPFPEGSGSDRTIGELLQLLAGTHDQRQSNDEHLGRLRTSPAVEDSAARLRGVDVTARLDPVTRA